MVHNLVLYVFTFVIFFTIYQYKFYTYAFIFLIVFGSICIYRIKKINILYSIFSIFLLIFLQIYISNSIENKNKTYTEGFIFNHEEKIEKEGVISSFPKYSFSNNQYIVQIDTQTQILVFTHIYQKINYLDSVKISGKVLDVRKQEKTWHTYYKKLNVQYSMFFSSITKIEYQKQKSIFQYISLFLFNFKMQVREYVIKKFSSHTSALILGMIFGEKNELSQEEKGVFNSAQLSHILVVSGYNISLVILFIFSITKFLNRYIRVLCAIIAIMFFILMIGFDSSVMRAGIMGSILVISKVLHRSKQGIHTVCLASIGMILWDSTIIFDAGFHLSVIATSALLLMPKISIPDYILSTVWIFLFIFPYILFMSGSISLFGIMSNVSVLFLIPCFMLCSVISIILFVCSITIYIDIFILETISRYIFFIANITKNIPQVSIYLSVYIVFVWYVILFGAILFFLNRYSAKEFIEKHYQKDLKQISN